MNAPNDFLAVISGNTRLTPSGDLIERGFENDDIVEVLEVSHSSVKP
jgi:hypothetical protein